MLKRWLQRRKKQRVEPDALYDACTHGDHRMVREMLDGSDDKIVNTLCGALDSTPLMGACLEGHALVVGTLLEHMADVNICNGEGRTALMIASMAGRSSVCNTLLQQRANVNVQDTRGSTALTLAAQFGNAYVVQMLVEAKAEPNIHDNNMTALMWAAQLCPAHTCELLLDAKAEVNERNHNGQTALICAASKDYGPSYSVVDVLVCKGAEIDAKNHDQYTALMVASYKGHLSVVNRLLSEGANPNAIAEKQQTCLMLAAVQGHNSVAESLIPHAHLNGVDEQGQSALIMAAQHGYTFIVERLLGAGADVMIRDTVRGQTALSWACEHRHVGVVQLFLTHVPGDSLGALLSSRNHVGDTALINAAAAGTMHTVEMLVNSGADVRTTNRSGNDALITAAMHNHYTTVVLLVDNKASATTVNHDGQSALSIVTSAVGAIGASRVSPSYTWAVRAVRALVANGADVHLIDAVLGESPMEIAKRCSLDMSWFDPVRKPVDGGGAARVVVLPPPAAPSTAARNNDDEDYDDPFAAIGRTSIRVEDLSLPQMVSASTVVTDVASTTSHSSPPSIAPTPELPLPPYTRTSWSVQHVSQWLSSIHLPHYIDVFVDASVDGEMLAELSANPSLLTEELGVTRKLHSMKILREIGKLLDVERDLALADRYNRPLESNVAKVASASLSVSGSVRHIPFGELALNAEVGRGAFGTVYRGFWRGACVAVKKLHVQVVNDEQLAEFKREARVMELMGHHPSVVRFLGICTQPLCIITQFVELGSVEDVMKKGTISLDLRTIVRIATEAASGMLHLAMEGIVHRDLAARNLLLSHADLSVRVSDFGMARMKKTNPSYVEGGPNRVYAGPIKWMAPEALTRHQFSEKSDVFSFGVTLWEMLSRRPPWQGVDNMKVAVEVANNPNFRLDIPDDWPLALSQLMRDCWKYDASDRPDFREILQRLRALLAELDVTIDD